MSVDERTLRNIRNAMNIALEEAGIAKTEEELPYGAVVISPDGDFVARAHDRVHAHSDPTRHAEFDAVRLAISKTPGALSGHILISTGEPCAMCSAAAWWAGIRMIAYGLSMTELKALAPESMPEVMGPIDSLNELLSDRIAALPGIARSECLKLWRSGIQR